MSVDWGQVRTPLSRGEQIDTRVFSNGRSLGDVIAHEIAHSWFGNLQARGSQCLRAIHERMMTSAHQVTNATWSEFWLNEGCSLRNLLSARGKHGHDVKHVQK
eukprot:4529672-Amphidinium_carterae.1